MADIHIKAEIPPEASGEKVMAIRAGAYQQGLSIASASPDFRLRMIMGEAYQKYLEIAMWAAEQIGKDEPKAPGLIALAEQYAAHPGKLAAGFSSRPRGDETRIAETQQAIIEAAVLSTMFRMFRAVKAHEASPLMIEHETLCEV